MGFIHGTTKFTWIWNGICIGNLSWIAKTHVDECNKCMIFVLHVCMIHALACMEFMQHVFLDTCTWEKDHCNHAHEFMLQDLSLEIKTLSSPHVTPINEL